MSVLKIAVLALVTLLVIISSTVLLLVATLERTVLDGAYYQSLLIDKGLARGLHQEIHRNGFEFLAAQEPELAEIPAARLVYDSFFTAFDADFLEQNLMPLIDDSLALFLRGDEHPELILDISRQKRVFESLLKTEVPAAFGSEYDLQGIDPADFNQAIEELLSSFQELDLPDQIDLVTETGLDAWIADNQLYLQQARDIHGLLRTVPLVALAVLLVLALLVAKAQGLTWFGAGVLVPAALAIIGLVGSWLTMLPLWLQSLALDLPLGSDLLSVFMHTTLSRILLLYLSIAGIAAAFIVAGILLSKTAEKKPL